MDSETREAMARLHQAIIEDVHHLTRNIPSRWAQPIEFPLYLQIILGQTVNGVAMAQYAADPLTVTTFFDAATDTAVDAGLAVGMLYDQDGRQAGRVLARHAYLGFPDAFIAGRTVQVGAQVALAVTVANDPPGAPTTGKRYTVGSNPTGAWGGHAGQTATWDGAAWVFSAGPASLTMFVYPIIRG